MWHNILQYFQNLETRPLERMGILVGGLLLFWIIEGAIPLFKPQYKKSKIKHAGVNFVFTVMHLIIHTALAVIIVLIADWCKSAQFGLVYWSNAGILMTIIIAILALDFSSWLVHLIMHKAPALWRFHLIHHTDTNVDVTTGLRHHPGDSFLRGIFFIIFIFVSGTPMYGVMIYQTLVVISTAFTHANISLPKKLDRALSFVFVSPNMHKVHHHWKQPYTDSNYGALLSVWDRFLGTFTKLDSDKIKYGIDRHYDPADDEKVGSLMIRPFRKF